MASTSKDYIKPQALYSQKVNKLSLKMNKEKLLAFMLRNIIEKYSINQLAKEIKISVGSAHKVLKELEKREVVTAEKLANAIFYKINLKNHETRKLCELLLVKDNVQKLKENKYAKIYAEDLKQLEKLSEIIILFGSIITKKEKAQDVDVLFIANKNKAEELIDKCAEISKSRTKIINPLIMTLKDFKDRLNEKDAVIINILRGGIILFGEDELVKLLQ